MKKVKINSIMSAFLVVVAGVSFASCSDWTTPESVKVNVPNTENVNSATYAKYLESLRDYKQSAHKLVYVWYDNTHEEVVQNLSQHESALPDSIDFVVLMNPDGLANREVQEMDTLRSQKGTKTLLSVDFDAIKADYDASLATGAVEDANAFVSLLTDKVNSALSLVDKYNYDGVVFKYNGMSTLHLSASDLSTFTAYQQAYLSLIENWYSGHSSKVLVFQGQPENLLDNTILQSCKNIIVDCTDATSMQSLAYDVELTIVSGVPTDRFIVSVSTVSMDTSDKATGYFDSANGVTAIPQAAIWVAQPSNGNYVKAGLGIYDVQNDFFNPTLTYSNVRMAINTLNPSPNQ